MELQKTNNKISSLLENIHESSDNNINILQEQNETIKKMNNNLDNIEHHLAYSKKIIKNMKSYLPWNYFWSVNEQKPLKENTVQKNNLIINKNSDNITKIEHNVDQHIEQHDEMDIMLYKLKNIKEKTCIQRELINEQNIVLDNVLIKTNKINDRTRNLIKEIKKI
ncbi:hypothetical protein BMW23_0766 [Bodo saltans virus]|uniref:t-SNARE coiled-coil homology domain-containing protein n=1 Tax=Bodo saltans virus TaxID=2024608 RepID=A0A2H4UV65_9VIRU|nr:hypothetical protein QJ851_gp0749 [Bodo saltans virus]ATZ80812.1 hypothetical protein BMW23_0766 [Bodo saltans virus]